MSKSIELLDEHRDFCAVTQLDQVMNTEARDLINDIFCKLFPDEAAWGGQTIITCWQNLFDANFHLLLYKALYQYYQSQQVDHDLLKLRFLADEATERYNILIVA